MDAIMMQITPGAETLLIYELDYIGFDLYDICGDMVERGFFFTNYESI